MPSPKEVLPQLNNDPIQTPTSAQKFSIKSGEKEYEIVPLYNYELYGMIVSTGDNLNWLSRFKDSDPLNANDLCVIWGSNIQSGIYQQMNFKNEEFICEIQYNGDRKDFSKYSNDHLSNNHLLLDSQINSKLYDKIRSAKAGDQIHFKGYLASYSVITNGVSPGARTSSTTREDSGNGACEVVYVTDFEIIKANQPTVTSVFNISKLALEYGVAAWLIIFILILLAPAGAEREREPLPEVKDAFGEMLPQNLTEDIKSSENRADPTKLNGQK